VTVRGSGDVAFEEIDAVIDVVRSESTRRRSPCSTRLPILGRIDQIAGQL